ncbi:uncharacterized protein LOC115744508 isoform X2 [Rhodamnia argentea]|uniref:Uncharacterized protein LOC115744508 isoform X2 n=1 Tax=Rhodamnia argentea TaxID=178133 RepID=A0ABM3HB62_9MYRT|nr:uncharacterized protein LOC115744508 isoform X2 [Rhodamnia argentea]
MGFFLVMRFIVIRCHIRVDNGKVLAFAANRRTCRARPHCPPVQGQALVLPLRNSLSFITRLFPSLLHPALPPAIHGVGRGLGDGSLDFFPFTCPSSPLFLFQRHVIIVPLLPSLTSVRISTLITPSSGIPKARLFRKSFIPSSILIAPCPTSRCGMSSRSLMLLMSITLKLRPGWEHLWPRSYGLVDRVSLSDLHNLRPSDINVNSSRGNKYYGECAFTSAKCLRPANKEAAIDTESDSKSWAPPRQVRGDIARALMYMAVCYGYHQPGGGSDLQLSDSPSIEKKEMGLLSTLLRWNKLDPPSREEKLRNDRICKFYQHNRNPFVDHPEYADLIWKLK